VAVDAAVQVTQGRGHVVWFGAGVGQVSLLAILSWSTSLDHVGGGEQGVGFVRYRPSLAKPLQPH